MRPIIDIAINQIRAELNARSSLLTLFVIPIVMTIIIGMVSLGPTASGGALLDVSHSTDPADDLAFKYVDLLRGTGKQQSGGKDRYIICDLTNPAEQPTQCKLSGLKAGDDLVAFARQRVEDNVTLAYLAFPEGFSSDLRSGKTINVQLGTKAGLTAAQTLQRDLDAVNTRLSGSLQTARLVTARSNGDAAFFDKVFVAADSVWAKDPIRIDESYSTVTGTAEGTGFAQSAPGIGAMFVLFNAFLLPRTFVQERVQGTLQRLKVAPLSDAQILAGKMLGQFLICLMTFVLMLITGTVFGVRWGDPLVLIVTVILYTLAITGLALAASTLIKTVGQAVGIGLLMSMVLAPLGGAWWPLSISPAWMQTVGKIISPIAWSQEAFSKMIFYGAHLGDVLPSIAALVVFTLVFFAFGLSRYRSQE